MAEWKVLRGVMQDKTVKPVSLVDVPGVKRVEGDGEYYAGDVVETDKDLSQHNTPGGQRFERVSTFQPIDKSAKTTWKILRGVLQDKTVKPIALVEVPGIERVEGDGVYYTGDIIETDKDLSRHNTPSGQKFERLSTIQSIDDPVSDLNRMTVADLRALAEQEEIDLGDAHLKDEIIEAIRTTYA